MIQKRTLVPTQYGIIDNQQQEIALREDPSAAPVPGSVVLKAPHFFPFGKNSSEMKRMSHFSDDPVPSPKGEADAINNNKR